MTAVVLFATGSGVIVDVEESLLRRGLPLAAGIRNQDGPCRLSDSARSRPASDLDPALLALPFLVPLFTPLNRRTAVVDAGRRGFRTPFELVDPTAVVPRTFEVGPGSYVGAATAVGARSRIGAFAFVNRGASLGHHLRAGDFVSIGPGAVVAGEVVIGDGVLVGAGAVILPKRRIGAGAIVGAGAVVTHDVPAGWAVAGNPARVMRRDLPGWPVEDPLHAP